MGIMSVGNVRLTELKSFSTNCKWLFVLNCHLTGFFFMELKDAKELGRVVYNKVDVILFGHKHVMKKWENRWGTQYILASDNSPGKSKAGEITIKTASSKRHMLIFDATSL